MLLNCLVIKSVDQPDDPAIKVKMDRVTQCPQELPDVSWLGHTCKQRGAKKEKQPETKKSNPGETATLYFVMWLSLKP